VIWEKVDCFYCSRRRRRLFEDEREKEAQKEKAETEIYFHINEVATKKSRGLEVR